jgi:ABC-type transport system involved in cytochrome c biogenesis permease subunit
MLDAPSLLSWLLYGGALLYVAALVLLCFSLPLAERALSSGLVLHLAAMVGRGFAIQFFPLTNKMESFSAAALALALVTRSTWSRSRTYDGAMLVAVTATIAAAVRFPQDLGWPPPLMRTVWYPLHVPLTFLAYGCFTAAAAAALAFVVEKDRTWLGRIDRLVLAGFGFFSVSMICGGVWGVVAWGAFFMWDPKIVWSVIVWFYYATFLHVRLTPSLVRREWVRPAFAVAGLVIVLVAYIGTSFFFGRSSHAF